jgi:hypothetical protein
MGFSRYQHAAVDAALKHARRACSHWYHFETCFVVIAGGRPSLGRLCEKNGGEDLCRFFRRGAGACAAGTALAERARA